MAGRIETYGEFWPFYLRKHRKRLYQALHDFGTTIAIVPLVMLAVTGNAFTLVGAVFGGYGFALAGHFFVKQNRPASFRCPIWSLHSDFRMYYLALAGRPGAELPSAEQVGAAT